MDWLLVSLWQPWGRHELHSLVFWVEQFWKIHPSCASHQVAKQTIKGWGARHVDSCLPCCAVGRDCCVWLLLSLLHHGESGGFKGGGGKRYLSWYQSVMTRSIVFLLKCLVEELRQALYVFWLVLIPSLARAGAVLLCRPCVCLWNIAQRGLSIYEMGA